MLGQRSKGARVPKGGGSKGAQAPKGGGSKSKGAQAPTGGDGSTVKGAMAMGTKRGDSCPNALQTKAQ